MDTSHLNALMLRLSHESVRLANARTPQERELRSVWVAGIEQEIAREREFIGLGPDEASGMTDDELLAELT